LARFIDNPIVFEFLTKHIRNGSLYDWQLMWLIGAMLQRKGSSDELVRSAVRLFEDAKRHASLRAVAAIYIGRRGDAARRRALSASYNDVNEYVQAAIFLSSSGWPGPEKSMLSPPGRIEAPSTRLSQVRFSGTLTSSGRRCSTAV
jgi:hypothetical protein